MISKNSKTCLNGHSKESTNWLLRPIIALMQVKSIAELFCSVLYSVIFDLHYATICILSFLSGRFTQGLLYL